MDLVKLLNDLVANIAALQAQLVDAQASADALAKQKYDEGFAAGVASVPPPVSDKIFSQAELDAAVAGAVEPLKSQIAGLQAELDQVKAGIDAKVAEAVAAVKAEFLAKLKNAEIDNLALIAELEQQ
jgi:uncharacterized small protein (DUF1192 family)